MCNHDNVPNDPSRGEARVSPSNSNINDEIDETDVSDSHSVNSTNTDVSVEIDNESNYDGMHQCDSSYIDSDSSENENNINPQDNVIRQLLYENCSSTVEESILMLLDLYVKNKWTKASLKGTLNMLQILLPEDNQMPKTVFKLLQYVRNLVPPFTVVKHFYCSHCLCYDGVKFKAKCSSCKAIKKNNCFFEIDIREQIKHMFEQRNLGEKLKLPLRNRNQDVITDVIDGSEYLRVNSQRQKYDLTLMLNTDGLSLVKSSKSHCWPLMLTILEVPQYLRESFLVTIGLWYDNEHKPPMNMFLKQFCLKLKEYFEDGISWVNPKTGKTVVSRIVTPLIIADAPARAEVQNIQYFNGTFGCNICEIKKQRARSVVGERNCSIYPYEECSKLRTGTRMNKQAKQVPASDENQVTGVKGHSVFSELPLLDLGTCVVPEYMHSMLLGVARQIISVWINKKGPWNIKKHLKDIDSFLLSIRPPHFFNRMPRSLTLIHFYKASEYYDLILFYSLPAFCNYLPKEYLQHWMLFVKSLFILLQETIGRSQLEEAEILLKSFVYQIKRLYSDRELSYNIHQMLHLVLVVKRWGPLWATSAFPFENFNGFLANCAHGTKNIGQEIINNLAITQGAQILRARVIEESTNSLFDKNRAKLVGTSTKYQFDAFELELFNLHDINSQDLCVYARATIYNELFTSKAYKVTKANSYTVQINYDNCIIYGAIKFFLQNQGQ